VQHVGGVGVRDDAPLLDMRGCRSDFRVDGRSPSCCRGGLCGESLCPSVSLRPWKSKATFRGSALNAPSRTASRRLWSTPSARPLICLSDATEPRAAITTKIIAPISTSQSTRICVRPVETSLLTNCTSRNPSGLFDLRHCLDRFRTRRTSPTPTTPIYDVALPPSMEWTL